MTTGIANFNIFMVGFTYVAPLSEGIDGDSCEAFYFSLLSVKITELLLGQSGMKLLINDLPYS